MIELTKENLQAIVYRLCQETHKPNHLIREAIAKGLNLRDYNTLESKLTKAPGKTETLTEPKLKPGLLYRKSEDEVKDIVEALMGNPIQAFKVFVPALMACSALVDDINRTGGVKTDSRGNTVPVEDEDWVDLGITAEIAEAPLIHLGSSETLLREDEVDDETRTLIDNLGREEVVEILEGEAGIQCYDHESLETLREALRVNVADGTIDPTSLQS